MIRILHVTTDATGQVACALGEASDEFEVTTVPDPDPEAARPRVEGAGVDCVIADHDPPAVSGSDLVERIREADPGVPVIIRAAAGTDPEDDGAAAAATDCVRVDRREDQIETLANRVENAVADARGGSTGRDDESALFENTPDPIVRVRFDDRTPVIDGVNPAFEAVFGFDAEAVVGRSLTEVLVPDSAHERHRSLRDEVVGGHPSRPRSDGGPTTASAGSGSG